jgi:hypothetical protein
MRAKWYDEEFELKNRRYIAAVEGTLDFTWNPGCPGSRDTPPEGGYPDDLDPAIRDMTLIDTDTGLEYVMVSDYKPVLLEINGLSVYDLMVEILIKMDLSGAFADIACDHVADNMCEVDHE